MCFVDDLRRKTLDENQGGVLKKFLFYFLAVCFFMQIASSHALTIPQLQSRVTDLAGVLNDQTKWDLQTTLKQHEQATNHQVAVLIIPSLQGENLEDYSMRVASAWKLGQANHDNGVLLLVALNDRKLRIEVGYGLESILTDAIASHIIQNDIVPHFKNKKYDQGIVTGVQSIVSVLNHKYDTSQVSEHDLEETFAIVMAVIGGSIAFLVFMMNVVFAKNHAAAYMIVGIFSVMLTMAYKTGAILLWMMLLGFGILSVFVVVRVILHHTVMASTFRKRLYSKSKKKSFWYSGLGTKINSSSGRSGSSGFSGGGGSFGGGGSSGSW